MAAADQALLDQIQRLSGTCISLPNADRSLNGGTGALRQARDGPTVGGSQPYGTYQYPRGRGRGRYQYNKFVPIRSLPEPSKDVEIGGQMFKASTNKLTRQTDAGMSLIHVH